MDKAAVFNHVGGGRRGAPHRPHVSFGLLQGATDTRTGTRHRHASRLRLVQLEPHAVQLVDQQAIDKQLSSIGSIGNKVNDLSARVKESEPVREDTQAQARLEVQKNYQQRLASQLAGAGSYAARNAVVTYLSVSDF